jgi:hypothetical protein
MATFYLVSCLFAQPVDKQATLQTKSLYYKLQRLQSKGFLFGHQDDLAYGVNWKYQKNASDVKEVCGQYPGMYGWELGGLENDALVNLDSVPFDKMRGYIQKGYQDGAAITISWHLNNPLTGKSAWDPSPLNTVQSILPGGEKNQLFNSWLDKVANFLNSLTTKSGQHIPVIFRPYHEINGSWFWWGGKNCTPAEIKQLWIYTFNYLKSTKNLHHLLFAYNTDRFATETEFLERYPGNEYVDIVGFDIYQKGDIANNDKFIKEFDKTISLLESIARKNKKIAALTEFGYNTVPDSTWWTNVFYKVMQKHKLAYAVAWRNAGQKMHNEIEFYTAFKGHSSAANFMQFSKQKKVFFQLKTQKIQLYK